MSTNRVKQGSRKPKKVTNFTYDEAHFALMSALCCERNYPMDHATVDDISRESDEWLMRAHQFFSKKFDRSIYDPDEILYRLYKQLRLELGFKKMVPRPKAKQFWKLFWQRALQEQPVKSLDDKRKSPNEKKLWRDQVRERVKVRFRDELSNDSLFTELSPAVRYFYELPTTEPAVLLHLKPTDDITEPHK
jgi:hypothetical protein